MVSAAAKTSLQEFPWIRDEVPQELAEAHIEKVQEVAGSHLRPGEQLHLRHGPDEPEELEGAEEGEMETDPDGQQLGKAETKGEMKRMKLIKHKTETTKNTKKEEDSDVSEATQSQEKEAREQGTQ